MAEQGGATAWIEEELTARRRSGLERRLTEYPSAGGRWKDGLAEVINFAGNDYLAMARDPAVVAAATQALERYGAGAGASRLVCGTLPCHTALERQLAALKGYPEALLFASGYAANVGVIPALVGRGDLILLDRLAHASLVDGALLSRATVRRFKHNNVGHMDEILRMLGGRFRRRLVVTESVFSMDGDVAPLEELVAAAERHEAMTLVDEAHATGLFGPAGAGRVRELGLEGHVTISMGTLSKALGSSGGFVACGEPVKRWLVQRARSLVYSTALPPAAAGAACGALEIMAQRPGAGAEVLERAARLRVELRNAGFNTGASASQIVPVMVGDNEKAVQLAARLRNRGIIVAAIRPPTVPEGTARLRISVTFAHSPSNLSRLVQELREAANAA